jgi:hypothetical protein
MTKNIEPEVHLEIPMALSPIPRDPDRRERNETKITVAAKAAMGSAAPLRGPLEVILSMSYVPGSSMRKGHVWRIVNPSAWALASFILPLLKGIVFEREGQVAKLTIKKTFGARPLTAITVRALV